MWYYNELYEAIKDNDLNKVIDITYNMGEWQETLTTEEIQELEAYEAKFEKEHPYKYEVIDDYFRKHRDVMPK